MLVCTSNMAVCMANTVLAKGNGRRLIEILPQNMFPYILKSSRQFQYNRVNKIISLKKSYHQQCWPMS